MVGEKSLIFSPPITVVKKKFFSIWSFTWSGKIVLSLTSFYSGRENVLFSLPNKGSENKRFLICSFAHVRRSKQCDGYCFGRWVTGSHCFLTYFLLLADIYFTDCRQLREASMMSVCFHLYKQACNILLISRALLGEAHFRWRR